MTIKDRVLEELNLEGEEFRIEHIVKAISLTEKLTRESLSEDFTGDEAVQILRTAEVLENVDDDVAKLVLTSMKDDKFSINQIMEKMQQIKEQIRQDERAKCEKEFAERFVKIDSSEVLNKSDVLKIIDDMIDDAQRTRMALNAGIRSKQEDRIWFNCSGKIEVLQDLKSKISKLVSVSSRRNPDTDKKGDTYDFLRFEDEGEQDNGRKDIDGQER